MHNLEALLRSGSVPVRTILDLLPELRSSADTLRDLFHRARDGEIAAFGAGAHGGDRVAELETLLDAVGDQAIDRAVDRTSLAGRCAALAAEIEASADLLALLDRAGEPMLTEVSLHLVAREARRMAGMARGAEIVVHFDQTSIDGAVTTDPHVLASLLSLMVACVNAAGAQPVVLRARSTPRAEFVVEQAGGDDALLPMLTLRIAPWVPPSEHVARRVAVQIGAKLDVTRGRASIALTGPR